MEEDNTTASDTRVRPAGTRPTIGLLIGNTWHSLSWRLWAGIEDVARERDANLICFAGDDLNTPLGALSQANVLYDLAGEQNVDGLVIWGGGLGQYVSLQKMEAFCERYLGLPVVNISLPLKRIPSVLLDNYHGMRQVITHLVQIHGFRRIAFARGPEGHWEADTRYRAYCDVLAESGIDLDPRLVAPGDFNPDAGEAAIELLFDRRHLRPGEDVEAIAFSGDGEALIAVDALRARGIHVPKDMAVTGFDNIEEGWYSTPALTTVPGLVYEQGRQAAEMLLDRLQGACPAEQVMLPVRLIVRQSCGCAAPLLKKEMPRAGSQTLDELESVLGRQRESILARMVQVVDEVATDVPKAEVARLLDAFWAEMFEGTSGVLQGTLEEILRHGTVRGGSVMVWQDAISALRHHVLQHMCQGEPLSHAEHLWNLARITIGEEAQRLQVQRSLQTVQRTQILNEVSQALITTFEISGLMDVAAWGLPYLGIDRALIALYQEPVSAAKWARLILAYQNGQRTDLESGGQSFLAHQLAPAGWLPDDKRYSMVVEPLFFQGEQLGFALLEAKPQEAMMYDAIRGYLSSALK